MLLAAIGVFMPAWIVVMSTASRFRAIAQREGVRDFVHGVTAAATGAMAGAAFILGRRAIIDVATCAIALITFAVLTRTKLSELWLIGGAAIVGMVMR